MKDKIKNLQDRVASFEKKYAETQGKVAHLEGELAAQMESLKPLGIETPEDLDAALEAAEHDLEAKVEALEALIQEYEG